MTVMEGAEGSVNWTADDGAEKSFNNNIIFINPLAVSTDP